MGSQSDSQLVAALSRGPVSVLIDASDASFQHYRSGVFRQYCGTRLDHAVLAVGYDSQSYKVKNSWGTWWGEQGYIRFQRQQGDNGYGNVVFFYNLPNQLNVNLLVNSQTHNLLQLKNQLQPHLLHQPHQRSTLTPIHQKVAW